MRPLDQDLADLWWVDFDLFDLPVLTSVESEFAKDCGEIRWPNPEDQSEHPDTALRGLFLAHPTDEWYVFTVLGNKATGPLQGNAWYGPAVTRSDEIVRQAIEALQLTPFTSW